MQAYGYADIACPKTPATTNTVFRIGSLTKQFIATAIMMLVEEGKIGLDDPVSKYSGWNAAPMGENHNPTPAHPYFGHPGFPRPKYPPSIGSMALIGAC